MLMMIRSRYWDRSVWISKLQLCIYDKWCEEYQTSRVREVRALSWLWPNEDASHAACARLCRTALLALVRLTVRFICKSTDC